MVILSTFSSSKTDSHFADFGQVKTDDSCLFLLNLDWSHLFSWDWARCWGMRNYPNPLHLTKNWRTMHRIWHKPFSMIQSAQIKNWISTVQSFIFLCHKFFWFVRQNKICMIRIKTKNFYVTGENIFQMAIFRQYCQELYFESLWWNFFEHIVNEFLLLIFFTKKPHHKCSTVFHKMQHKSYSTCFIFIISNNNAITIRN